MVGFFSSLHPRKAGLVATERIRVLIDKGSFRCATVIRLFFFLPNPKTANRKWHTRMDGGTQHGVSIETPDVYTEPLYYHIINIINITQFTRLEMEDWSYRRFTLAALREHFYGVKENGTKKQMALGLDRTNMVHVDRQPQGGRLTWRDR
jgi:hypothetical protein